MIKYINQFFFSDKWNIGYVNQSASDFIEKKALCDDIKWLRETSVDYAADPFVFKHKSKIYIIYEELKDVLSKGTIQIIENFDISNKKKVSGIEPENIHLSYPYIFESDGKLFCIPETARANEVALYEVDANNLSRLKKVKVLLSGEHFVDSSIIKYEGKFWLFTSISGKYNCFYIYYATDLFGEFKPHYQNTFNTDAKNFRNAGNLFVVNDKLYRPTQNLEFRYGGSLIINEITELTEHSFYSKPIFEVTPKLPYDIGLHNISLIDNLIVFDGKRSNFSLTVGLKKIVKKLSQKVELLF